MLHWPRPGDTSIQRPAMLIGGGAGRGKAACGACPEPLPGSSNRSPAQPAALNTAASNTACAANGRNAAAVGGV
jgi:hypothetical protein